MNTEQLEKTLETVRAWIIAVDQKTSILFAVEIGFAGLVAKPSTEIVMNNISKIPSIVVGVLFVSTMLLVLSAAKLFLVVKPRVTLPNEQSLIFFGLISRLTLNQYRDKVRHTSNRAYKADLVTQIYATSKISAVKHSNYSDAVVYVVASFVTWIIFVISSGMARL